MSVRAQGGSKWVRARTGPGKEELASRGLRLRQMIAMGHVKFVCPDCEARRLRNKERMRKKRSGG